MRVLFDTSVLIAAVLKTHESHQAAAAWLFAARSQSVEMIVSAHSLAELYSILTRIPRVSVPPAMGWTLIDSDVLSHATLRSLSAPHCVRLLKRLADDDLVGGIVFDAVIAEVARLAKVDALLTLNVPHFRRVWPGAAERVITPLTSPPPSPDAN